MKPCRITPRSHRAENRGVTLIELMIAVTIGLLLVVVLAQLFLGSRQTFATTDDISRMQDNIRFTQILLTRTIHLAGYKSQANSVTATVFQPPNRALEAVDNAPPAASDVLTIRYQGSGTGPAGAADGTIVDCLGQRVNAGVMVVNTFSVAQSRLPDGTVRLALDGTPRLGLFCWNGVGLMPGVEIVSDVLNMQVQFGEDTDGDLVANRYVNPATVAGNVNNVVSVRVSLLFETPTQTSKTAPDAQEYYMLGDKGGKMGPYNDRRIRRLVVTTINLRNRTP